LDQFQNPGREHGPAGNHDNGLCAVERWIEPGGALRRGFGSGSGNYGSVTHKAADRVGNYDEDPECEPVRDIRKYVFTAFRYAIYMVAKKQSSPPKDFLEMNSLARIGNRG